MTEIKKYYQQALDVQDACNLSGVAHSLSRALEAIWKEARDKGEGTDYVNTHPVVVMFVSKLDSLCGASSFTAFGDAYDACKNAVA